MSIRTRIIIYFTAFIALILCVIYLVQIILLGFFYRKAKNAELDKIADEICSSVGTVDAEQLAYESAWRSKTCIIVFSVLNSSLNEIKISIDESPVCVIHNLSNESLNEYFSKALDNGGELLSTMSLDSVFIEREGQSVRKSTKVTTAVLVRSFTGQDGNAYALFLNTEMSPMVSVASTLKSQFSWLTLAILFVSVLVAYFFSNQISRPLIAMTAKARRMAKGDYTPDFKEEGYLETRQLAATLNYAATEIAKTDKLRRELISNVSHDLRTPLTMISGYAEVMRDIPGENTPENVQVIIDESKHLTSLVNDMLDLSKIESGVKKMNPEHFCLTDSIRDVMTRYSALTEHEGYTISFEDDGPVYVIADRTMIIQVVYNLVNNAVNYSGDDKMVVVKQITERSDTGVRVKISVSDTGDGISPENINSVWERYYREDKTHKRAVVGTGLGLSIVREILQKHNASFGVESTEGQGSTFWFELPAV